MMRIKHTWAIRGLQTYLHVFELFYSYFPAQSYVYINGRIEVNKKIEKNYEFDNFPQYSPKVQTKPARNN